MIHSLWVGFRGYASGRARRELLNEGMAQEDAKIYVDYDEQGRVIGLIIVNAIHVSVHAQ